MKTNNLFLLTPLREGRRKISTGQVSARDISTHAPAGGATELSSGTVRGAINFYSRPCGRGDLTGGGIPAADTDFYSRPCGRGDPRALRSCSRPTRFLLTPLREGRRRGPSCRQSWAGYFYSRPCGRGD